MSEQINHVGWAQAFIQDAERPFDPNEPQTREGATVAENLAFAQVHATLALVQQQRITNRLAVALIDQLTLIAEDQSDQPPVNVAIRIRDYLSTSDWASVDVGEGGEPDVDRG